jgi:hypothetical protein
MPTFARALRPPAPLRGLLPALVAGAILAACAGPAPSASSAPSVPKASTAQASAARSSPGAATPALTTAPPPTPIVAPSATAGEPTEPPDRPGVGTTRTDWGMILDQVPEGFPVYPGASPTDPVDGPASGAWFAEADAGTVADWYRNALEALGYTTQDLSSPLEDGSRVLDTVSDLPECRIQTTFRPANGSTMITVLYGAGCAGGEG